MTLWNIRQRLKKESYKWYSQLREGEYEYLHEFKERINEIMDLQRMHHEIIIRNDNDRVYNPTIIQNSLAELHRLNITLSNYISVAPLHREPKCYRISNTRNQENDDKDIIV